jgi:hypothetical protein
VKGAVSGWPLCDARILLPAEATEQFSLQQPLMVLVFPFSESGCGYMSVWGSLLPAMQSVVPGLRDAFKVLDRVVVDIPVFVVDNEPLRDRSVFFRPDLAMQP